MTIDKKWLNQHIHETLDSQHAIEKIFKANAQTEGVEPGYHIVYTNSLGERIVLTGQPLGGNLQEAKEGLLEWLVKKQKPADAKSDLDKTQVQDEPKKQKPTEDAPKESKNRKNKSQIYLKGRQAALDFLYRTFPKCFLPPGTKKIKVLAVGIGQELANIELPPGILAHNIKAALGLYCNLPRYVSLKKKIGTPRINLEGEVVGAVTEDEVKRYWEGRGKPYWGNNPPWKAVREAEKRETERNRKIRKKVLRKPQKPVQSEPQKPMTEQQRTAKVEITSLKITLPLTPEMVPRDILPPPGTPGGAKMKVFWDIVLTTGDKTETYKVGFAVKNYHKVLDTMAKCEADEKEYLVLLQGKLMAGGIIESAGLSVQVKTPKVVNS